jgi:hypothetical protein
LAATFQKELDLKRELSGCSLDNLINFLDNLRMLGNFIISEPADAFGQRIQFVKNI